MLTGTPGVGKTTAAKALGKKLKYKVVNEKEFALQQGIGMWSAENEELFMPMAKLRKAMARLVEKEDNLIVEGHLLCETKLKVDVVILLRLHPELLGVRLSSRGYKAEKIEDNVFCEGIDYCKKKVAKRYPAGKVVEVNAGRTVKETIQHIMDALKKRGKL